MTTLLYNNINYFITIMILIAKKERNKIPTKGKILLAGLGNPGEEHRFARHNIGFLIIDEIQKQMNFPEFEFKKEFQSLISTNQIESKKIILLKPKTFMNNSGKAIIAIKKYYKQNLKDILIIHDELDIPLGKFKIKKNQGSAGHNGVESIIKSLGSQNFWRVKVGIENRTILEKKNKSGKEYVLENFSLKEEKRIFSIINQIIKEIKNKIKHL